MASRKIHPTLKKPIVKLTDIYDIIIAREFYPQYPINNEGEKDKFVFMGPLELSKALSAATEISTRASALREETIRKAASQGKERD